MKNYKIVFYDNDFPYPIGGNIRAHSIEEAKQFFNKGWSNATLVSIEEDQREIK